MEVKQERPTLYIGDDPESRQAEKVLREAGFNPEVRMAPLHYQVAYGVPVLFSRFGTSFGLSGIRILVQNVSVMRRQEAS